MTTISSASPQPMKEWTILYYLDGKNNLAKMAEHSFTSIDKVGSDDNVNLVAQMGVPKEHVLQGLVRQGQGKQGLSDIGDRDMGSADNVQQFVEWGMKNYPAKHYMLVMWDHGAGFKGAMTDDETKHVILNKDLAAALEAAQRNTGQKLEVINWNACLMNQAETGYELRNAVDYMVGSEEVEAGFRLSIPGVYGTTPQHLVAKDIQEAVKTRGSLSAEELAKLIVWESKNQLGASMFTPTQSAIDLKQMPRVADCSSRLAGVLCDAMKQDSQLVEGVRDALQDAQHFLAADMYVQPYSQYRDLGDFARKIEKSDAFASHPEVATAAVALQAAIHDAVIAEWHAPVSMMGGRSLEGATGLSVYGTPHYGFDPEGTSSIDGLPNGGTHGHEKTSFAQDTRWDEMLKMVARDDDWMGSHPNINRALSGGGQAAAMYGYEFARQALAGVDKASGWAVWPMDRAPYMIPIPSVLGAVAGAVGGVVKVEKGYDKVAEGLERVDSPTSRRAHLAVDGTVDIAIGLGTVVTCGAMLAGVGSAVAPVAAGVLGLGIGRMGYNAVGGLYNQYRVSDMTVQAKLDEMADARPQFASLAQASTAPAAQSPATRVPSGAGAAA